MWLLKDTDCIENIVEKGEIARFKQFHHLPQCFPKAFFFSVLKQVYLEERVNTPANDLTETSILYTDGRMDGRRYRLIQVYPENIRFAGV